MTKPVIGVSTDRMIIDGTAYHGVGDKYLRPIEALGGLPRLLPALGGDPEDLLTGLDGLLLTGAVSNVEPHHYGGGEAEMAPPFDPDRDRTTLPLIRAALDHGIALLAICRGHQELNVALGGSLHPRLHEVPGRFDHRAPDDQPPDIQYRPRHKITLSGGLAAVVGATETQVNSLHGQAIDRLAPGLIVEALAEDGTIEAVRVASAVNFAFGVQWHPEWRYAENAVSVALFTRFMEDCRWHLQQAL